MRRSRVTCFVLAAWSAMAVTTPLGLVVQRFMSFTLLDAGEGWASWLLATGLLAVLGPLAVVVVGLPVGWVTRHVGFLSRRPVSSFVLLAAPACTALFHVVTTFAVHATDTSWLLALSAVFFGVHVVTYSRLFAPGPRAERPADVVPG